MADSDIFVQDGNAFSFIGAGTRALRRSGRQSEIETFTTEMTSGDYENLIRTFLRWFPEAEIATS